MAELEPFLGKKYKLKTSDNFEDYLKFIEVGLISRKTAMAVSPVAVLTKNPDGSYTLTMTTPIRTLKMDFRLDEEFVETRADGLKAKSVMTADGTKLIQTSTEDNGRRSVHVREFTQELLVVTTTAEGWNGKCVRTYELVK
ncbi:hypothetical protein JYU34_011943 [Plutella xylostella]|uniref:Cytosolic fatty-acid binding proteins domain-containing protein n=1 Tax=Plutella xylostella TaxID=51655 RepID=A0ABQ7QHL2_PLUXY|nr:hypothetical protein JYU34_011943 [Plutella xylostella]